MCNFSLDMSNSDPQELINKAQRAINGAGGNFMGDATCGSFDLSTPLGSVAGSYTVQNAQMIMNISKKPMFIPCKMIEEKLKEYLV